MSLSSENEVFVERLTEAQADLFSFVASMLPFCPDDVNDVAQQTNLALIKHSGEYDVSKPFKPWMSQFARNEVSHFLRAKGRSRVAFDEETVEKSAEYLADERNDGASDPREPTYRRLAFCKGKLSEEQRRLIDLRYTHLCGVEEIARQMRQKVQNIYNALAYVRRKLADCLRRMCRIGDEEFERMEANEVDDLCESLLDKPHSSLHRDSDEQRAFLAKISASEENLFRYLDEMTVHQLLSNRWAQKKRFSAHRLIPAFGLKTAVGLAAAVAILLAGGALLASRKGNRPQPPSPEKTQPVQIVRQEEEPQPSAVREEEKEAKAVAVLPAPQSASAGFSADQEERTPPPANPPFPAAERQETEKPFSVAAIVPQNQTKETMKTKTIAKVAVAAGAMLLGGRALGDGSFESAPVTIHGSANDTLFWRTYNTVISSGVSLDWPTNAAYAELTCSGMGEKLTQRISDTSKASWPLALPAKDAQERVYGLKLVYRDADGATIQTLTATNIALVCGIDGAPTTLIPLGAKSNTWSVVKATLSSAVLPVPPGTTALSLNGATVSTGFGKYPGWFGWYPIKTRINQLSAATPSQTYAAVLQHWPLGTVVILR